jgi:hypothetical protein
MARTISPSHLMLAAALALASCTCSDKKAEPPAELLAAAPAPKDFVTGCEKVSIGMTEAEVSEVLGGEPISREGINVRWRMGGRFPGGAMGRFLSGKLVIVEFGPLTRPEQGLPKVDAKIARDLVEDPKVAARAATNALTLADVEAIVHIGGYRATWTLMAANNSKTSTRSRWVWALEGAPETLVVDETDGHAAQPVLKLVD